MNNDIEFEKLQDIIIELDKKEKKAAGERDYDLAKKYQQQKFQIAETIVAEFEKKEKKAAAEGDYDLAKKYQQLKLQAKKKIQKRGNNRSQKNMVVTKKEKVRNPEIINKSTKKSENMEKISAQETKKNEEKGEEYGEILAEHDKFLDIFNELKKEKGLDHTSTLEGAIDLINSYIGLYKLDPCNDIIDMIFPLCKAKSKGGTLHIKAIQCRAFLRYKQHRFKESLKDFIEFRKYTGPSAELAENMGHVYNTLGDYPEAENSFEESLRLMKLPGASEKSRNNKGGVLLGLGIIKDRLGDRVGALKYLYEALDFYKKRFKGVEHSLIAKTLTSVAAAHEKANEWEKAEHSHREAVRIFKFTCGHSPLTANALFNLAKCLNSINLPSKKDEAKLLLLEALDQFVRFDALSVYMQNIIELLTLAKIWAIPNVKENDLDPIKMLNAQYAPYVPLIIRCHKAMQEQKIAEDVNAGVFYKCAGEILMLAGKYKAACPFLRDAIRLLNVAQKEIEGLNASKIIDDCEKMLELALDKTKSKSKIKEKKKNKTINKK